MEQLTISFVIPSYNEAGNIANVMKAIADEMMHQQMKYEVLFVDDGSTDGTMIEIRDIQYTYPEAEYVSFTRNFGKEAAIIAGLQHAKGQAVILMDADLQHPPSLISELLKGFEEGYDQVIAKRNRKGDSHLRSLLSSTYYRFVNKAIDVQLNDGEGDFRLLSRRAVDSLLLLSEGNRFSKGLYAWIGLEQKTITYENVTRQLGETKWSFSKLLNYAIDGIVSFNTKPLRLCLYIGLATLTSALIYIFVTLVGIFLHGVAVPGYFTTISAVLFLGGVQLLSLGIIGEYIGRIYNETKKRPHYLVQQTSIESKREGRATIHGS
ncbi:glycosyltransferase family 2 protein [Sporosarcina thermotolerans]|uniref:Glycosyltransferase family 2 protein n=1 Tax=Sporosarcina thermotolerans TaxID=633404 RepID=A0AAW9A781_9BACL|nr:glycosyltransferase family 2 protein [Sporosarcina thermotolerans]MDW0116834.1 glycosyltransferase family 2 protein [Sporosarcina thermotolerans]WHT49858.1 glycosyltransferase family 2 protein [Sporosarcina thermotolerans]